MSVHDLRIAAPISYESEYGYAFLVQFWRSRQQLSYVLVIISHFQVIGHVQINVNTGLGRGTTRFTLTVPLARV